MCGYSDLIRKPMFHSNLVYGFIKVITYYQTNS